VVVPFHDAPTCAMRELHESRGIRHRSCSRRSASDGAILASDSVGQAVAHLAASLSVVMLLVSPSHPIGVLVRGGAAACSDARRMGAILTLGTRRNVTEGRKPSIWNRRGPGSRLAHDAGTLGRDVN
jgi:hypothetical protein